KYEEEDVATSGPDRFRLTENFVVTKASYALDLQSPPASKQAAARNAPPPKNKARAIANVFLLCIGLPIVIWVVWSFITRTKITPLAGDPSTLATMDKKCSPALQPFFVDFAKKALAL